MPVNTKIEWTQNTWNPVSGCTQISPGCDNCYAKGIAERMGSKAFPNGFDVTLRPHKLSDPLKWKQPSLVFVNSISDLFHRDIPEDFLTQIWTTMLTADHHTYQVLTKRPHRMVHKLRSLRLKTAPHIWLGVSVENQAMAKSRIPTLLETQAAVKWLSCEPLLGSLDLTPWIDHLQWVISGGESGSGRRLAEYNWFREIRDQCVDGGVAYFHKQGNSFRSGEDRYLDGRTWDEYPSVLR